VNDLDEKVDDITNKDFKKKYSEIVKALIDEVIYCCNPSLIFSRTLTTLV